MPPDARYLLGTMEALPVTRDVAFVGIDEAQLGADPERGHVFTDRLLKMRGLHETLFLGSDTMRPAPECVPCLSRGAADPVNRNRPGDAPASTCRRTESQTWGRCCHSSMSSVPLGAVDRSKSALTAAR